jgi:methylmalonyl-CoA mutase N-terminal domain/subunit
VEGGWIHKLISDSAYAYQQDVESGRVPVVGVNSLKMPEEIASVEIFQVPETLSVQRAKLTRLRTRRDPVTTRKALDAIRRACEIQANLMPVIMDAVKAPLTQGEISAVLREVYGTWTPPLF